jgi:hypothetical protein
MQEDLKKFVRELYADTESVDSRASHPDWDDLTLFAESSLEAGKAEVVRQHLQTCEACNAEVEDWKSAISSARPELLQSALEKAMAGVQSPQLELLEYVDASKSTVRARILLPGGRQEEAQVAVERSGTGFSLVAPLQLLGDFWHSLAQGLVDWSACDFGTAGLSARHGSRAEDEAEPPTMPEVALRFSVDGDRFRLMVPEKIHAIVTCKIRLQ